MIKDYRLLIKLHHINIVQILEKYVKQYCYMEHLNVTLKYKTINFDDVTNENKTEHSRSFIRNNNNWSSCIKKNKCAIKFHTPSNRYNIYNMY